MVRTLLWWGKPLKLLAQEKEVTVSKGNTARERGQGKKKVVAGNNGGQGLAALPGMVANGELTLAKDPSPAVAPAAAVPVSRPQEPETRAGSQQYNDFFGLYALSVREKKPFRSLGFIPGPAVLLDFREGNEVRVFAATSDVAKGLGTVSTPWMIWDKLPEEIRQAIGEWRAVVDGLGYEPSPYNIGLAKILLAGRAPAKYLAMVMPYFRYRAGDPEKPFGAVLIPVTEGGELTGLKVKIFNPQGIPDVPADGTVMSLADLKDGRGPVQKLLRTTALMEGNYLGRYDRDGNRRQPQAEPRPQPAGEFRRPTW